jgi:hypothetical protein
MESPLTPEENLLLETVAETVPADWTRKACESMGLLPFEAAPKIAAFVASRAAVWLSWRTWFELAECQSRVVALQNVRARLERIGLLHEDELLRVLDAPPVPVAEPARFLRVTHKDEPGTEEEKPPPGNHLLNLGTALRDVGGAGRNLADIIKQEREETQYRLRLLDRLDREMKMVAEESKTERIRRVGSMALQEGRFPEAVRLLSMLPSDGGKAPTKDKMLELVEKMRAKLTPGA